MPKKRFYYPVHLKNEFTYNFYLNQIKTVLNLIKNHIGVKVTIAAFIRNAIDEAVVKYSSDPESYKLRIRH